jgi:hypothetical protein
MAINDLDELRAVLRRIAALQAAPQSSRRRAELDRLLRALSDWRDRQGQWPEKPLPAAREG